MVSNILGLFYGILAVDKDLLNEYFDDSHLIGFERHSKVHGLIFNPDIPPPSGDFKRYCVVKYDIQTSTRFCLPVLFACRCCQ